MIKNLLLAASLILPPSMIGNISVTDEAKDKPQLEEIVISAVKQEMP